MASSRIAAVRRQLYFGAAVVVASTSSVSRPDSSDGRVGDDAIEDRPPGAADRERQHDIGSEHRENRDHRRTQTFLVGFGNVDARQGSAALFERQRPPAAPKPVHQQEQAGARPCRQDQPENGLEQGVNELRRYAHGSVENVGIPTARQ